VAETSAVVGTAALVLTTAFRDPLWTAVANGPVRSIPVLAALTLGAGLAASLIAFVALRARRTGDAPDPRQSPGAGPASREPSTYPGS
jgi:hypothetical protein